VIIASSLTAVGMISTAIVRASIYITLPERVDAGEVSDERQDKILDRITTLQEFYQQQAVSNQANVNPRPASPRRDDNLRPREAETPNQ